MLRKDRAPDWLATIAPRGYFNRDGFCFAFTYEVASQGGVALLRIYFQNQFEHPCVAEIGLRPTRALFRRSPKFGRIRVRVACDAAALGVATVALPIPEEVQGASQRFDVGATVKFPCGRGRRLRFVPGLLVYWSADLVGGWAKPKGIRPVELLLPKDVDAEFEGDGFQSVRTLWKLGEPLMERWPEDL